ncbi:MAG: thiaminase II [Bacteroidota bacterium]|nr:thiaminase II [Bacteroidota bacterium]MDW8137040.1 thiaminase II [Bacteroidota bacterium]
MRISESLWRSIEPIYDAILRHPFNQELARGELACERFAFYLQQDALYLVDFGRALALMAARAHEAEDVLAFARFAQGAVEVERALHESYFRELGIRKPLQVQSPACFAYTNFLLATAACRSLEEGMAALLPCFWIYREVGRAIYAQASPDNPYRRWIDTYASEQFASWVERAIAMTDRFAAGASKRTRALMQRAFEASARLEWMFWDSAYRMESWPPA